MATGSFQGGSPSLVPPGAWGVTTGKSVCLLSSQRPQHTGQRALPFRLQNRLRETGVKTKARPSGKTLHVLYLSLSFPQSSGPESLEKSAPLLSGRGPGHMRTIF